MNKRKEAGRDKINDNNKTKLYNKTVTIVTDVTSKEITKENYKKTNGVEKINQ